VVCIPDSHAYRIISIKCHIYTVIPPGDGPREVRNTFRFEIILTKCTENIVHQFGLIYEIIWRLHGQQNMEYFMTGSLPKPVILKWGEGGVCSVSSTVSVTCSVWSGFMCHRKHHITAVYPKKNSLNRFFYRVTEFTDL
jgi:hypothetical protein